MSPARTIAPTSALLCLACVGSIAETEAPAPPPPAAPGTPAAAAPPPAVARPGGAAPAPDGAGPWPLARLTREELDNTLRDLLGHRSTAAQAFPADTRGAHGFLEATASSDLLAQRLLDASAELAAGAMARLPMLFSCAPATAGEDACVLEFIRAFGRRAFRRPLTAADVAAFQALDRKVTADLGHGYQDRLRVLVRAFLLSPELLFRGPMPAGGAALGPYEIASRLSYALWRTMPDEPLFAAAASGRLAAPDEVERQARRMLADRRALDTVDRFHVEWLELEHLETLAKDAKLFPMFSDRLRASIRGERATFLRTWFAEGAPLDGLLTAPHGFVDAALARLYGVPAPAGTGLQRTALPAGQRAGVLTQIAFLAEHADAAETKPIARGKVVYEQLLCGTVPPPPLEVPEPAPPRPGLTTRERFEEHARNECARGCHALIDPPGFAFERYDALGVHRTQEAGRPIDASGTLLLPTEGQRPFRDAVDLIGVLARSRDVRRCVVTKWARFVLGRAEHPADAASLERAADAFERSGQDVRELLVALATSRTFLNREVSP